MNLLLKPLILAFSLATWTPLFADEKPDRLIVATWNVEWLFDEYKGDNRSDLGKQQSAPSREAWNWKRDEVARVIAEIRPTIIALQEIENKQVLYYLTGRLREAHDLQYRVAFIEGNDYGTEQDVGILFQSGLVEFSRREQTKETFGNKDYYHLSKHLFARFEWGRGAEKETLLVATSHFRAAPEQEEVRKRQGRLLHSWLADQITRGENIIVLGDFNSEVSCDDASAQNDIGVLRGLETSSPDDDLADLHTRLDSNERNTHMTGKQYDRVLMSRPLETDEPGRKDLVFQSIQRRKDLVVRGAGQDADHFNVFWQIPQAERDVSDHYPLVAEWKWE